MADPPVFESDVRTNSLYRNLEADVSVSSQNRSDSGQSSNSTIAQNNLQDGSEPASPENSLPGAVPLPPTETVESRDDLHDAEDEDDEFNALFEDNDDDDDENDIDVFGDARSDNDDVESDDLNDDNHAERAALRAVRAFADEISEDEDDPDFEPAQEELPGLFQADVDGNEDSDMDLAESDDDDNNDDIDEEVEVDEGFRARRRQLFDELRTPRHRNDIMRRMLNAMMTAVNDYNRPRPVCCCCCCCCFVHDIVFSDDGPFKRGCRG